MSDPLSVQEVRREAEKIRLAVFAHAIKTLFYRLTRSIFALQGLIHRAQTVQRITEFDDNWLAEFGMRRPNIAAYVAGQTNSVTETVIIPHNDAEHREAA